MFSKGTDSKVLEIKHKISEIDIASYYLAIKKLPTRICSPLRQDKKPSFGVFTRDGIHVYWTDFANGDKGNIIDLLQRLWGLNYEDTWLKIYSEMNVKGSVRVQKSLTQPKVNLISEGKAQIETQERHWEKWDEDYWNSYGISIEWLEFANVHPISHVIFIRGDKKVIMPTDKLAYAFLEFKEGNITTKIYQPLNKNGLKWFSSHDRSVISLWTKVPQTGDRLIICSSLKDALCLWANTGIPAIAPQGEGYTMSETAINELKKRFKKIYILYDNDKPGLKDGISLAKQTGFTNLILPSFEGGKDVSDAYKVLGKKKFLELIKKSIK
jgi:DNA primase